MVHWQWQNPPDTPMSCAMDLKLDSSAALAVSSQVSGGVNAPQTLVHDISSSLPKWQSRLGGEAAKWSASAKDIQKSCKQKLEVMQNHLDDIDNIDVSEERFREEQRQLDAAIQASLEDQ